MAKVWLLVGGDITYNASGQPVEIDQIDAATQNLGEQLLQAYDPSTNTGNKLIRSVKSQAKTPVMTDGAIRAELTAVVSRLQKTQSNDPFITPEEQITGISQLDVFPDPTKKTDAIFFLDAQVASGATIKKRASISFAPLSQPQATAGTRIGRVT